MQRLEARLGDLAARGQIITYGALARELGWRVQDLTAALESLMEFDASTQGVLRAALCEGRLAGGQPAPGFFLKAAALGFVWDDPAEFVATQRVRLFKV